MVEKINLPNHSALNEEIKKQIESPSIQSRMLQKEDIKNKILIPYIHVVPDSSFQKVKYKPDSRFFIVFFPRLNAFYSWNEEKKDLFPILKKLTDKDHINFWLYDYKSFEHTCVLSLFPGEQFYFDWLLLKPKNSHSIFFLNERMSRFSSLNELLEYNFGSKENYIETYRKRMTWNKKQ